MASSVIMPTLGQAFSLDGRARETICTSTGTVGASLVVRAASSCACSRSNSARLDLARLSSARSFTSSPPAADHALLGLVEAPPDAVLAHGGDLRLALEPVDDLADLGPDLPVEAGQLGIELLHARMRRQQRRRQLGDLPLDAHALLDEARHQLRFLHVGQRLAGAAGSDLAGLPGAGLGLGADGGHAW